VTGGNPELFDDPQAEKGPEEDTPSPFFQMVARAEEALGGAKIGRPRGARNRKTKAFEDWFFAKGYKDPAQLLAEIVSADPIALRAQVPGADMLDVIKAQIAAAGELMPYLHGKKPIDLNVTGEVLPTLILMTGTNQLEQAAELIERRRQALSVGAPIVEGEANEIKDLEPEE
jgi:hypothetical protein